MASAANAAVSAESVAYSHPVGVAAPRAAMSVWLGAKRTRR